MAGRTYHAAGNKTTRPRPWLQDGLFEDDRQLSGAGRYRCAVNRIAGGIDQPRGDEDKQVALFADGGLALEQPSDHRQIAEERNFIINLLQLFRDKAAQNDRLTAPNYDPGD